MGCGGDQLLQLRFLADNGLLESLTLPRGEESEAIPSESDEKDAESISNLS